MLFNLWVVNKSGGLVYARELAPSGTRMSGNEALMGASTFHSLHAIAKQLAPVPSGGITAVEAPGFALHCFESPTGVKFFCTTRPGAAPAGAAPGFLRRVYEAYADYVLKVRTRQQSPHRRRGGGCAPRRRTALPCVCARLPIHDTRPPARPPARPHRARAEPVLRAGHAHPRAAVRRCCGRERAHGRRRGGGSEMRHSLVSASLALA